MSEEIKIWIAVDRVDGEVNVGGEKPQGQGAQFWECDSWGLLTRLAFIDEDETIFGVGRGQCRQFKLVPVGELIDGKTEVKG